jgi:hypothetical protein
MNHLVRTILLSTFFALSASAVYPCLCEDWKPSKKLRKAKVVFVGEVVEIERNDKSEWATVAVKFKIERYWKGVKRQQYITIVTPVTAVPRTVGRCGLPVKVSEKYLIYANETDGQLEMSSCTSIELKRAAKDLAVIGEGKKLKLKT